MYQIVNPHGQVVKLVNGSFRQAEKAASKYGLWYKVKFVPKAPEAARIAKQSGLELYVDEAS